MAETLRLTDSKDAVINSDDIQQRVNELGMQLAQTYAGQEITVVTALKGALTFSRDLRSSAERADTGVQITHDIIRAKSYDGAKSTGDVRITNEPWDGNIQGKKVVLVEDIWDTGRTLAALCGWLQKRDAESVEVYTFLNKPNVDRAVQPPKDVNIVTGIDIDDKFVVGYGLDYDGLYRELPFVVICDQVTENLWTPRYLEEPIAA